MATSFGQEPDLRYICRICDLTDALGMALRADSEKRHPASARGQTGVFPYDFHMFPDDFYISDEKVTKIRYGQCFGHGFAR